MFIICEQCNEIPVLCQFVNIVTRYLFIFLSTGEQFKMPVHPFRFMYTQKKYNSTSYINTCRLWTTVHIVKNYHPSSVLYFFPHGYNYILPFCKLSIFCHVWQLKDAIQQVCVCDTDFWSQYFHRIGRHLYETFGTLVFSFLLQY